MPYRDTEEFTPLFLSDARGTPAQEAQGGQLWGEAVPAAGRVQGAGLGAASAPPRRAARARRASEREPKVCLWWW